MPKATRLEQATRIETVRQLILSGVEHGRIVQQVSAQWKISERQGWNYMSKAQDKIIAILTPRHEYLLAEHLAVRRDIRRRAREAGDLAAELRASQDEAKLFGLYPADRLEIKHTWQTEVADLLRAGKVTQSEVVSEYGEDLAKELFELAGVTVSDVD